MSDHGMPVFKVIFNVSKPEPDILHEEVRAWNHWDALRIAYQALLNNPDIGSLMVKHITRVEILGGHASLKNPALSRMNTQDEVDKELRDE